MASSIMQRVRKAWNVFRNDGDLVYLSGIGAGQSYRQDRARFLLGTEQSIVSSIYTRIGIDVSAISIQHVRLDDNGKFKETLETSLNDCLTVEANLDQTGRAFIQDAVMSLCDEGSVAIVPVETSLNPAISGSFDILSLRTARVVQWYPQHVQVNIYNEKTGMKEDLTLPKRMVAIVENPLYSVMNEPNSTLKRLIEKLNLLDAIDSQSGAGKLDIIVQLPFVIKTEARQKQAEARKAAIESQLKDSQYGIAYVDGTEKITQLNRPAENNLMGQIEYLTRMLYSQLGLTEEVFNGTADEKTMINYYNRTVEPILAAITDSMRRVFITKTARTQGQSIMAIRDPFRLVSSETLAELADKFTRNEIMSSNEFRGVIGMKPSSDPKADELRNKNLNQNAEEVPALTDGVPAKSNGTPALPETIKIGQNGRS